ncbi:DUF3291 domain-containing protein [Hyphobacterium sp. CCMP332]|nr:DUF3291 domain-containing protein [Hyphobacterium sp. CCMP332]
MILSITHLKLKSPWKIFPFMATTAKIIKQLDKSAVVNFKSNSTLRNHYTMSLWKNEKDMRDFYRNGDHAKAMKNAKNIAAEIKTIHFEADAFLPWKKAKKEVDEKGKKLTY